MSFVRRTAGKISAVYAAEQPGEATEYVADDNAELLAFLNPPERVAIVAPSLFASAGFTITDGAVTSIELAAQLAGAFYEDGWVQVYFAEPQTTYLVFVTTDTPCLIEQFKSTDSFELIFSDAATGDAIEPGRIDLQILKVTR